MNAFMLLLQQALGLKIARVICRALDWQLNFGWLFNLGVLIHAKSYERHGYANSHRQCESALLVCMEMIA